jgi:hypothetical protein
VTMSQWRTIGASSKTKELGFVGGRWEQERRRMIRRGRNSFNPDQPRVWCAGVRECVELDFSRGKNIAHESRGTGVCAVQSIQGSRLHDTS